MKFENLNEIPTKLSCESVVHVLWVCPLCNDSRGAFMAKLARTTKGFGDVEKTSFVLGCELWEENFEPLLVVVKD